MGAPRLGYVVRFVDSLDRTLAFYELALEQRCTKRTEHWAQLDCGSVLLGLYERAAMAAALDLEPEVLGTPPGAVELAFEVEDCDAAHAAVLAAGARGVRPPADRPWGERTAYVLDPDGGLVELYARSAAGPEAAAEVVEGADCGERAHVEEMATPSSAPAHRVGDPSG